jgi:hypothetical protein
VVDPVTVLHDADSEAVPPTAGKLIAVDGAIEQLEGAPAATVTAFVAEEQNVPLQALRV